LEAGQGAVSAYGKYPGGTMAEASEASANVRQEETGGKNQKEFLLKALFWQSVGFLPV
jgi:hypothetical protein